MTADAPKMTRAGALMLALGLLTACDIAGPAEPFADADAQYGPTARMRVGDERVLLRMNRAETLATTTGRRVTPSLRVEASSDSVARAAVTRFCGAPSDAPVAQSPVTDEYVFLDAC